MSVGGIAVRVRSEALSSGSLRLKHSTAEQFFGADKLDVNAQVSIGGTTPATCNTFPVRIQLRSLQPTGGQPPDASTPSPPSLHRELCGLGAWLRGQGAVPGVHWVQLWRGAGGALRLRLCDGKPTELPGEEADDQPDKYWEQQARHGQHGGAALGTVPLAPLLATRRHSATAPGPIIGDTGSTRPIAAAAAAAAGATAAAAAGAAGLLVGAAAQDVADAAAPWELSRRSLAKEPAVGRAAAEALAMRQPAAASTAGHERPAALPAASKPCPSAVRAAWVNGSKPLGYSNRTPLAPVQGTGGDSRKATTRATMDGVSGVVGVQPVHSTPTPSSQLLDSSLSTAHHPMPPAPTPPTLHDPFQAAAAAPPAPASSGPVVHTVVIGPDRLALLDASALGLWPWADALRPGQRCIVVLRVFVPGRGAAKHTPKARDMTATLFRIDINTSALEGTGMSVRAGETLRLAQGPDGKVWAWLQRQPQQQQPRRQHPQQQHQQQQLPQSMQRWQHPQQEQQPQPQQDEEEEECNPQQVAKRAKLHEGSGLSAGNHPNHRQQDQQHGEQLRWQQVQGAARPAAGQGPPLATATAQAPRLPMPDPTGRVLVGNAWDTYLDMRCAAVEALFPAALGLTSGQSMEVGVHAVASGGYLRGSGPGQQQQQQLGLAHFRLRLKFNQRKQCRVWRLRGCGPLFRALGARNRDAIFMRRLPGGGRIVVEMEPRCWVESRSQRKAPKGGSSRRREEELELSETGEEEEEGVEVDDGFSGKEEGRGGVEGQAWNREEGEEDVGE